MTTSTSLLCFSKKFKQYIYKENMVSHKRSMRVNFTTYRINKIVAKFRQASRNLPKKAYEIA